MILSNTSLNECARTSTDFWSSHAPIIQSSLNLVRALWGNWAETFWKNCKITNNMLSFRRRGHSFPLSMTPLDKHYIWFHVSTRIIILIHEHKWLAWIANYCCFLHKFFVWNGVFVGSKCSEAWLKFSSFILLFLFQWKDGMHVSSLSWGSVHPTISWTVWGEAKAFDGAPYLSLLMLGSGDLYWFLSIKSCDCLRLYCYLRNPCSQVAMRMHPW